MERQEGNALMMERCEGGKEVTRSRGTEVKRQRDNEVGKEVTW